MSVMMQLAPETHRAATREFLNKSAPVIPEQVNPNWHVNIDLINMDTLLQISFITVCYRNLECLARRQLSFTDVADTVQKMLKLAVLEVSSEDSHYQQGLDVSTREQTLQHKASLPPAVQGAARQAEDQTSFFSKRKKRAREVIKLHLSKMGDFVRKWLGECEIKIKKNMRELEPGRKPIDQAYEDVPTCNGHLQLFGAEVPPKSFLLLSLHSPPVLPRPLCNM